MIKSVKWLKPLPETKGKEFKVIGTSNLVFNQNLVNSIGDFRAWKADDLKVDGQPVDYPVTLIKFHPGSMFANGAEKDNNCITRYIDMDVDDFILKLSEIKTSES